MIGESPVYGGPVPQILNMLARRGRSTDRLTPLNAFLSDAPVAQVARADRAAFFSPRQALCSAQGCLLTTGGQPIHWDEGHLSVAGSVYLAGRMEPQLRALLPAPASGRSPEPVAPFLTSNPKAVKLAP